MSKRNNGPRTEKPSAKRPEPLETGAPKRRRRKPDAAESEILDAAESFLREKPFRDMTVDDIMARTGLSRPSFYEYFRDRHHMVIKLAERLGDWTIMRFEEWLSGNDDSVEPLKLGMDRMVSLYQERGHLLRALSDAAIHDRQVEITYNNLLTRFIEAAVTRIQRGMQSGVMKGFDSHEVATALVLMNEGYLIHMLSQDSKALDPALISQTLLIIWQRVLYG